MKQKKNRGIPEILKTAVIARISHATRKHLVLECNIQKKKTYDAVLVNLKYTKQQYAIFTFCATLLNANITGALLTSD